MSVFGCAVEWVVGRVPELDGERRAELTGSVHEVAAGQGRLGRMAEVASLGGLALRLRGRRAASGGPVAVVRSGVRLGGRVVLAAAAATALGRVAASLSGTGPTLPGAVVAAAAGVALLPPLLAVVHGRGASVGAAGVGAAYLLALHAADLPVRPAATMLAVGLAAVFIGPWQAEPRHAHFSLPRTVGWWVAPVLVVAALAATLGPDAADVAIHVGSTLLVPGVLVAAGWFDPRYATAAGVVWLWRFLAADLGRIPHETVTVIGDLKASDLLLRLGLMATGVVCAWAVARASLRRAALL